MLNREEKLTFEQFINVPPAQVYRAFVNSSALREWMCDFATTDPNPGGRIYMWWNSGYYTAGEYKHLDEDHQLSFTWFGRGEPTQTSVDINLDEESVGTKLTLIHNGIGSGPEWEAIIPEYKKGWSDGLENLVSVLESGPDLRITRRPMLGILINDFNEEIAKQLNIPVKQGIRIDNAIAGMGAESAGLMKDDVIVGMGGKPVTDFNSLANALSGHYAGRIINVEFYRGPQKKSVAMTLSGRPIPEIPPTGKALSEAVRNIQEPVLSELKELLDGVSDMEASHKAAPNDWSINEIIGHLIHGEEDTHIFIQDLVGGNEAWYDDSSGNIQARIDATLAVNPSKEALFNELSRASKKTLVMLANLPEDFLKRKSTYWRLGYGILQAPYHFNIHKEQMLSALNAARNP